MPRICLRTCAVLYTQALASVLIAITRYACIISECQVPTHTSAMDECGFHAPAPFVLGAIHQAREIRTETEVE